MSPAPKAKAAHAPSRTDFFMRMVYGLAFPNGLDSFHTFIRERVQAAIFETHHGGEYDATNVIPQPVVTAITSLGMDHVAQLGPTIDDIAWHKSGIFKPGAARWFADNVDHSETKKCRALIFSHYSEERDGMTLLEELARGLFENDARPDKVIFTTYNERRDGAKRIDM
ncbi:hypothetical protein ZTR_00032 [Talaromyces verruculosus]|nr:hypothetical protein ZTR_00032 [Talaromyces verruculosus]